MRQRRYKMPGDGKWERADLGWRIEYARQFLLMHLSAGERRELHRWVCLLPGGVGNRLPTHRRFGAVGAERCGGMEDADVRAKSSRYQRAHRSTEGIHAVRQPLGGASIIGDS